MAGRWGRGCVTFGELWKSEQVGCGWFAGEGAGGPRAGPRAYGGDGAGWRTKKGKGGIVVFVGGGSGEAGGELWVSLS